MNRFIIICAIQLTCNMHEFCSKSLNVKTLGRPWYRQEDKIKMVLRDTECDSFEKGPRAEFCEHCKEPTDSIKPRNF
jgi:hypothetical protein